MVYVSPFWLLGCVGKGTEVFGQPLCWELGAGTNEMLQMNESYHKCINFDGVNENVLNLTEHNTEDHKLSNPGTPRSSSDC